MDGGDIHVEPVWEGIIISDIGHYAPRHVTTKVLMC